MDAERNLKGKSIFYSQLESLGTRQFLRRNLKRALDSHEKDLERERSDIADIDAEIACDFEEPRFEWMIWSKEEMKEILTSPFVAPVLRISSLHLRKPGRRPTVARPRERQEPDWLPAPDTSVVSCQIIVTIVDSRSGANAPMYKELRQGRIVGLDNSNANNGPLGQTFDIELESPFDLSRDQLAHSCWASNSWPEQLKSCALEIAIQFQDSDASEDFIKQLLGDSAKHNSGHSQTTGGIVRAKLNNLLHLPVSNRLLDLRKYQRGSDSSILLEYGVEVIAGWCEGPSPLQRYNKALRRRTELHNHMPTPVSDDMESNRTQRRIKYLWRHAFETRSLLMDDYRCILCQREHEHTSFNRLRMHYKIHHDHFHFEIDERSNGLRVIRIHHAQTEPETKDEPNKWQWQAPPHAFDIDAHIDGDNSWMDKPAGPDWTKVKGPYETSPQKKPVGRGRGRPAARSQQVQKDLKSVPKKRSTDPNDVEDLRPRRRQRHRVPDVPGVQFYRTTSKQKLMPGTLIYDSDEDVDDDWLKQSQRRDLRELGQDHISIDFHELFNRHLDEEQPMADVLTSDTVVRFARKFANLLSRPAWREKFEAKLEQFETRRVIKIEVVNYCLGLLDAAAGEQNASQPSTRDDGKENAAPSQVTARASSTGKTRPQPPPGYPNARLRRVNGSLRWTDDNKVQLPNGLDVVTDTSGSSNNAAGKRPLKSSESSTTPTKKIRPLSKPCICGEKIAGKTGTIACANPACLTYGFHMSCVGLETRPENWRCAECSS